MTRGKIVAVLPDGRLVTSTEFNGDMYYSDGGYGQEIVEVLENIETEEEYREFVEDFNGRNFRYTDRDLFYDCVYEGCDFYDMSEEYFFKWFSDYVYVKNLSDKTVIFTDADKQKIALEPDALAAFKFGKFYACNAEDFERRDFVGKLKFLREGLGCDMEDNYEYLWNLCSVYDNNHRGANLTRKITDYNFVDNEDLEFIVKEKSFDGVTSLRVFINDTYDANLYRLDGYGNLANVEISDFEELIDDLVNDLERDIRVPLAKQEACL